MPDGTLEQKVAIDDITKCNECGNTHLVRDYVRGELVCESCGLVLEQNAIDARGPRIFDREDLSKVHASRTNSRWPDKGLGSFIGKPKDAHGKSVSSADTYRLSKWQKRSHIKDRNLIQANALILQYSSRLGLPGTVRDEAMSIYKKAAGKNMILGNSTISVVSAALFYACKVYGVPRSADEIVEVTKARRISMFNINRRFTRELGLATQLTLPRDYVPRFCSLLWLDNEIQNKAYELLKQIDRNWGRSPISVAAAAIYISSNLCGQRRTQREISEIVGVTEVTIRNRYQELTKLLGIELAI